MEGQRILFRTSVTVLSLFLLTFPTLRAGAQDEEALAHAREAFEEGERLYEQGAHLQAAEAFERSYRLMDGRATQYRIAYNIGKANFDAEQWPEARRWLELFLAEAAPDDELRAQAETMIREANAREGQAAAASDDASAESPAAAAATGTAAGSSGTGEARRSTASSGGISPIGPVVIGIGAAALIGAAITGAVASADYDAVRAQCADDVCPEELVDDAERVNSLAIATDVLWVSGAVIAATGIVLTIVLADDGTESSSATARLRLGVGRVGVEGSF